MKTGNVALIVKYQQDQPVLLDTLSDEHEIQIFQEALKEGVPDPLEEVYQERSVRTQADEEFGDYVEDLLSHPFVRREIQEQGVQWLQSKIRIEKHQQTQLEASKIITDYAYRIFRENPSRTDFLIAGPRSGVRVRIFVMTPAHASHVA